ncbi:MAG: porphobilinogen synthase [Candidatus Bathyarchaeota archaeon]|nr:porphobilinogen synthase [Candidatus Bathyarchaeota archaeon]
MNYPKLRMRRLRATKNIRDMVRETTLSKDDFIYPLFVKEGIKAPEEISSMPGQYQYPLKDIVSAAKEVVDLGIPAVMMFGIPEHKDEAATSAYDEDGVTQKAINVIKEVFGDQLLVIGDVCLCEYMSHGHCGIVEGNQILNDPTLELYGRVAVTYAKAGADMVAPSGMMDGQVGAIRYALDEAGYQNIPIMAYSAKQSSNFYGPFRDAAESAPSFGDRRGYQMDYANKNEALRETEQDIVEGADIVMVKPALAYLDMIHMTKEEFRMPTAAYNVSGEYSMVKAAAANGWINEQKVALEILTAIKRAGADMIITYHAKDAAKWLKE